MRVLLGLPRWRSPAGLRVAPPVTVLRASRGSLPTPRRDRLSGRGGSAGKYPGGGGGRWTRPAALARTAAARTPKKTVEGGEGSDAPLALRQAR